MVRNRRSDHPGCMGRVKAVGARQVALTPAARSCAPLIGGLEINSVSELPTRFLAPVQREGPPKSPVQSHLTIVAGHSPYEEPLLVLRIDDPEFFDCCFQC